MTHTTFFEGRYSKSYRGATVHSCFTLGIPSGHSAGSHSTTRAISSTRRFPAAIGVEGAFKQAKRPVRLCRAEQVKYARLQHRLERKEDRSSSAGVAGDCFGV